MPIWAELNEWAPKILAKMHTLRNSYVPRPISSHGDDAEPDDQFATPPSRYCIQPHYANTLYDAFGHRQVTQLFPPSSTLHVIPEILLPRAVQGSSIRSTNLVSSPTTGDQVPASPRLQAGPSVPVRPLFDQ